MNFPAADVFVEAPFGSPSLLFSDEKQQARFELGTSMMIYKWDALTTAVQNGWGGPDSAEKRDWVTAIIVDLFKNEKVVDAALIEETLLYAMVDEFDTNVEDGSAVPISIGIIDIYKQCLALDFSTVSELYESWLEKEKSRENETPKLVRVERDPLNPDVSSEEEDDLEDLYENEGENMDVDMDENEGSNIPEPVIDDDGFELVQKKGKNRQN